MNKTFLNIGFAISLLLVTINIGIALSPSDCGYEIGTDTVKYCGQIVSGADAASFKMDPYYGVNGIDKNHAYFHEKTIIEANPGTFQVIDSQKSKDTNNIFCGNKVLTTDVQNFKSLQDGANLSSDGSAVYYGCDKLENSDPKTFTVLYSTEGIKIYDYFYKDKNNVYYQKYRLGADANSFQELGNDYAKDTNTIYFKNAGKVTGTDLKSFHIRIYDENNNQLNAECGNIYYDAYDDFSCYSGGILVMARNKSAVIVPNREKPYFSDIEKDSLDYFYERRIFVGYSDGTFGFKKNLTRAELIKIIMIAGLIPNTANKLNCFSDVKNSDWFAPYVCTAKDKGFIQGYEDGSYKPNNSVNKVEALKMIAEVLRWPMSLDVSSEGVSFKDTYKSEWYYKYVIYALNSFFIEMSNDHNFNPASAITRGDAADILFRTIVSQMENGSAGFKSKNDYDAKRSLFFEHYQSSQKSQ